MYLWQNSRDADGQSLTLYIRDLEHPVKDYEEMYIELEGIGRIDVPITDSEDYKSEQVTFTGLETYKHYGATGYVKYNGQWHQTQTSYFPVPELKKVCYSKIFRPLSGGQRVTLEEVLNGDNNK